MPTILPVLSGFIVYCPSLLFTFLSIKTSVAPGGFVVVSNLIVCSPTLMIISPNSSIPFEFTLASISKNPLSAVFISSPHVNITVFPPLPLSTIFISLKWFLGYSGVMPLNTLGKSNVIVSPSNGFVLPSIL